MHSFTPLRAHGANNMHPCEGSWGLSLDLGMHFPLYGQTGYMLGACREFKCTLPPLGAHGAHLRPSQRIWACIVPFAVTRGTC